jgi:hypothetical protein
MTTLFATHEPAATDVWGASISVGSDKTILRTIQDPDRVLAVWQRGVSEELRTTLAQWNHPHPFEGYVTREDLPHFRRESDDPLRKDIVNLISDFLEIADVPRVKVFVGPVVDDRCRKFHVDKLRLRLVCTYAGPGTEWLPEGAANRDAIGKEFRTYKQGNRAIVKDETTVRRFEEGNVLLFKGTLHEHRPSNPIIHRSPPVMKLGLQRFVLIVSDGLPT